MQLQASLPENPAGVSNRRVKNEEAEAVLPSFDFAKQVGRKIALTKFRKQMLVVVVDAVDFDGSLPTQTLKQVGVSRLGCTCWAVHQLMPARPLCGV